VYPEIGHWGFLHLRTYGLMLAVAFLIGTWVGTREARRLGLDEDKILTVILVALVSSIFGARLLYVLEHIDEYRRAWPSVLAVWQGGLTLYGGIVGGTVGGLWMAKRAGLPMWRVADALAPSIALGTVFGRIGCFLNGCCYGKPTQLPWGVVYPKDSFPSLEFGSVPIHPSQLYFSAAGLVLFVILWAIRKRTTVPGHLFWLFVIMYALVRIPLDMTRAYEPSSIVGHLGHLDITESQVSSLLLAMFGVLMMLRLSRRSRAAALVAAPTPTPTA
jgi:phosphatidylglycerol:prolipoprotein diacylglycerol transferase